MSDMVKELADQGIRLHHFNVGSHKTVCPRCSHTRKNKKDPCLWVNITEPNLALWKCHNCFWTGGAGDVAKSARTDEDMNAPRQREYKKPAPTIVPDKTAMPKQVTDFLMARGITPEVIERNRIYYDTARKAVAFPYYFKGELINVKYRTVDKRFQMEKGARLTFYGLDDVAKLADIVIVEGEFDKLALEVCGMKNVISVPNGAPAKLKDGDVNDNSGAFEYLIHAEEILKGARRVTIAVDNDQAGNNLRIELTRRIGLAKCFVVEWPEGCKDANDALQRVGIDVTLDCINSAVPCPISGLYSVLDFNGSLIEYFETGMRAGVPTGFENLDRLYSVMPGEITVVTGVPNSGKSEFIDALMINLSKGNNWRFGIFSPENSKEQHVTKLVEKVVGAPTSPASPNRMDMENFLGGVSWVGNFFYFIVADDGDDLPTLDWILDKAHAAVFRYGIKGLVIDPYNEIEHNIPPGMNETMYVSKLLSQIKRFARAHAIHIWIIAHPTKMKADKDGKMQVPSLYDISGSANWVNKTDNGLVVFRSEDAADQTEIHVKKIRFKHVGRRGMCHLNYDKDTGRYTPPKSDNELGVPEEDMSTWDPPA